MAKTVFVWEMEPGQGLAFDYPDDVIKHLRLLIENINAVRNDPTVKTVFVKINPNGIQVFAYEAEEGIND